MKKALNIIKAQLLLMAVVVLFVANGINTNAAKIDISPVYNAAYYAAHNPDLAAAGIVTEDQLLAHFQNHGMAEGRQGSEEFNVHVYKNRYPDLAAAYGNDLKAYYIHYITTGKAEGRSASGASQAVTTTPAAQTPIAGYYAGVVEGPNALFVNQLRNDTRLFPDYVKASLEREGFTICLTGNVLSLDGHSYSEDLLGYISFNKREIWIRTKTYAGIKDVVARRYGYDMSGSSDADISHNMSQATMYHEVGHYVDYKFGNASESAMLSSIRAAEQSAYESTYYYKTCSFGQITDNGEYFAEAYSCYLMAPTQLMNSCPQTYAYIQSCEAKYRQSMAR